MLDNTIAEILLSEESPANAIGLISSLVFHRLLKKVNVVIHDIDLEQSDHYFGTFLLEKPQEAKTICKVSLESAVKEIVYENKENKKVWTELNNLKKLRLRMVKVLKPRVRLAEILSSADSVAEAQRKIELKFGNSGRNMLIIRKGA